MNPSFLCLNCWRALRRDAAWFRCDPCQDVERPDWLRHQNGALRPVRELRPPWYRALFSGSGSGSPRCPRHPDAELQLFCECRYPLSERSALRAGSALGFGIAGPRGSGKTLFMITLLHELRGLEIAGHQLGLVGLDDTEERFHRLSAELFDAGVKPDATPPEPPEPPRWTDGMEPPVNNFAWSIALQDGRRNARSSVLLAVNDLGGETWELPRHVRHPQVDRYLDHLGSLAFLVDGMAVAADLGLETEDAWDRSPPAGDRGARTRQCFSRVVERLGRRARRSDLALVVSKADGLWDHDDWRGLHPGTEEGKEEVPDDERQALLEELLRRSRSRDVLIEARLRFRSVRLFAASSLGFRPGPEDVDDRGRLRRPIEPVGVTEPVEWLLKRRLAGLR